MSRQLRQVFSKLPVSSQIAWFNTPPRWICRPGELEMAPAAKTDFWRVTHFGHTADNGHALLASLRGDGVLSARLSFSPCNSYDQAGLLIRLSALEWMKFSLEMEPDSSTRLGVTMTRNGVSDWSAEVVCLDRKEFRLSAEVRAEACLLSVQYDDQASRVVRIAPFATRASPEQWWGVYAACPVKDGCVAHFDDIALCSTPVVMP